MSAFSVLGVYRDRSFWALQLAAWSLYALDNAAGPTDFFPHGFVHVAAAVFVTSLLHPVYLRLLEAHVPPVGLATAGAIGSAAAAMVAWLIDSQLPLGLPAVPRPPVSEVLPRAFTALFTQQSALRYALWSAAYFTIKQWEIARGERERGLEAANRAQQERLRLLTGQLSPHFLFNTLNSVQALVSSDPARAERTLDDVSSFLLYTLRQSDDMWVTLADEAGAIEAYIAIQAVRFEDRLQAHVRVEEEASRVLVPHLLIYPLVENAIKYGMQTGPLPVRVAVSATARSGGVSIEVRNSGRWTRPEDRAPATGAGMALQNVRLRLAQLYPGRHRFDIVERDGEVRAVVELRALAEGGWGDVRARDDRGR